MNEGDRSLGRHFHFAAKLIIIQDGNKYMIRTKLKEPEE
jgi:hypothetical protein